MKKMGSFLVGLLAVSAVGAQDNTAMKKHYLGVYTQGLRYNDPATAIGGLQGYIAIDSNIVYKDTLAMLYYGVKNYYSSLLLSEEVYKAQPSNAEAMARAAECYDQLGDPKTAVGLYEQVVPKTKNPYHIYKLAVGQYQLKRTLECEVSARAVLADTNSAKIGVAFTNEDGSQQAIPVSAAAANLLGVLQMDAKNYAAAKQFFSQAVSLYPKFEGAKQNLDMCEKAAKGGTKPPAQKPPAKKN